MFRFGLSGLLCAVLLGAPTLTAAQFGGGAPEEDDAEDTPESLSQDAFHTGQSQFARGNYGGAADAFREAYEFSPRAELLYNIGECELRDDQPRKALVAFDAYLEAISSVHPRRAAIVRRVEELRAEVARLDAGEGEGPGAAPWVIAGVGGAVAVVGGVLLGVGAQDLTAANSPPALGTPPSDVARARGNAEILIGVGVGLLVAGLATLTGGLYWGLTSGERSLEPEVEIGLGPGSLHLRGTF